MDLIDGLLDGPRARGAFLLRAILDPPWCLRIQDEAPLCLVAVLRGDAWVSFSGTEGSRLSPGDVAIIRGTEPYTVADRPGTPPQIVIHPGQRCTTPDGVELHEQMDLGVRTWGTSLDGESMMLIGTYETATEVGKRLLGSLPRMVVVDSPMTPQLAEEIVKDEPGQQAVLDRLLDLMTIAGLRSWLSSSGWSKAHHDPVVGTALKLMHHHPAHPWTLNDLAARSGVSRAALARRFTDLVGEPPIAYLTGWRLALAADLLLDPDATVGSVAARVGYSTPFALSTAFKRVRGVSPQQYRSVTVAG